MRCKCEIIPRLLLIIFSPTKQTFSRAAYNIIANYFIHSVVTSVCCAVNAGEGLGEEICWRPFEAVFRGANRRLGGNRAIAKFSYGNVESPLWVTFMHSTQFYCWNYSIKSSGSGQMRSPCKSHITLSKACGRKAG